MRVKAKAHVKRLFARVDSEIEYEADTIEDMEKLMELAKELIKVNVSIS